VNFSKAHFIGIAGAGMSATAKLLLDQGITVTGSDEGMYPPVSDFLRQHGIGCKTPYAAENLPADVDLIVDERAAGRREAVRPGRR
jgi:UDP-N-acetylmuramate: L-alanyl-gamma-D-glutamyl-meso-diaminopimelate ligase